MHHHWLQLHRNRLCQTKLALTVTGAKSMPSCCFSATLPSPFTVTEPVICEGRASQGGGHVGQGLACGVLTEQAVHAEQGCVCSTPLRHTSQAGQGCRAGKQASWQRCKPPAPEHLPGAQSFFHFFQSTCLVQRVGVAGEQGGGLKLLGTGHLHLQ